MNNNAALLLFTIQLQSFPNPDFGQTEAPAPSLSIPVASLYAAQRAHRQYIADYNLGSGNIPRVNIVRRRDKHVVAQISFNGRAWNPDTGNPVTTLKKTQ